MKYVIRRKADNLILNEYAIPVLNTITGEKYFASDITTASDVELVEVPDFVVVGEVYET